jgi:hypothetical protein
MSQFYEVKTKACEVLVGDQFVRPAGMGFDRSTVEVKDVIYHENVAKITLVFLSHSLCLDADYEVTVERLA